METKSVEHLPLVVIVGPTASGKTALSIKLAKRFNGEIICADSRSIYKGMDIGTAKPSHDEQSQVPHWGINLIEPGERYTVVDFKAYATSKIEEIRDRGHVPFLVGGTGLYTDAIVFDYQFGPDADEDFRKQLEGMSLEELHDYCDKNNIPLPENRQNKRYVVRAIEQGGVRTQRRSSPISTSVIVGIATDRDVLRERIRQRAEQMFDDDVVNEAILLGKKYGWDSEAMTGNIYPIIHSYLENEITLGEAKQNFATADWQLAKRQLTWMRRNSHIRWLNLEEAEAYLEGLLAKATKA